MRSAECGMRNREAMRSAEFGMRRKQCPQVVKRGVLLFFVVVLLAANALAAEPLGKRLVLENGMVLLLSEKHELPVVTVNMAIRAGSLDEPADKPGLAAITASLLTQ